MVTYSHLKVVIEATERFWVKGFTRAGVYGLGKQVWGIPKGSWDLVIPNYDCL